MNKDALISALDDLSLVEADFMGWICWHDRYDPKEMGFDMVIEILELQLEVIGEDRAAEILETKKVNDAEAEHIKAFVKQEVSDSGGEETSFWVGTHPDHSGVLVGMYQYEDGSRGVADVFATQEEAEAFPNRRGFDLV